MVSDTLTRRERREQQRRQRHRKTGKPSTPNRRPRIGGIWIVVGIVVLGAILIFGAQQLGVFRAGPPPVDINLGKYNLVEGEVIGQKFPDEGNSHLPTGQKATYNQNPPTSGSHWNSVAPPAPVPWGIKDAQQPNEAIVHNMEHGGVVIFWKGLSSDEVDKLKDLVRLMTNNGFKKIVLEPYADMSDAKIAVSAWDWGLKLPGYDDVQIVKFVKSHYDGADAPERGVQ
jgi:hypothetical protein